MILNLNLAIVVDQLYERYIKCERKRLSMGVS